MPVKTPQSLEDWQSLLADQHLPILERTRNQIQKIMANPHLSITMYADPIHYDAGFCAEIFREVNLQRSKADKLPLTTLASALSHFGQSAFKSYVSQCQLLEKLGLAPLNLQGYLRTMQQACHAGLQARDWSQQRNVVQPEEPQLAALMQSITELMLWCYGDDVMPRVEELYYIKKLELQEASQQVLGCTLKQLGSVLAEKWVLPEMASEGLSTREDDFTLATGVSLAYEMSRVVSVNWYGERQQKMFSRIAHYKGKADGEIERRIHLNAVAMTEEIQAHGYEPPARLLPQLADDQYVYTQYQINKTPAKQAVSQSVKPENIKEVPQIKQELPASPARQEKVSSVEINQPEKTPPREKLKMNQALIERPQNSSVPSKQIKSKQPVASSKPEVLKQQNKVPARSVDTPPVTPEAVKPEVVKFSPQLVVAIKQFNQKVEAAEPAHNLIEQAVKMCLLCGVDRSKFFVKIPNKEILASRYFAEQKNIESLGAMKINIDKPNLFRLLMEKPRNLFLNENNQVKYLKSVPEQIRLLLGGKQFFATSIFVNNHAMGLMYADKLHDKLTEDEYKQFLAVCKLLSKGIVQSAHNKKKYEAAEA